MSNYLSRLTVIVLALSLGAFSLGCSDEYPRYDSSEVTKCDLADAPANFLVTRFVTKEAPTKNAWGLEVGWNEFQFQWVDAESRWEARKAKDWSEILSRDEWVAPIHLCTQKEYDRYFNPTPTTTLRKTTTTKSSINTSQCKADFKKVEDNLDTWNNDFFDRLFRKTLYSCGNRSTWKKYAPSSVSTMLTAGCMLNSSTPVCRS